jgi:alpha-tubulin suppressor-like RCC1 family protein
MKRPGRHWKWFLCMLVALPVMLGTASAANASSLPPFSTIDDRCAVTTGGAAMCWGMNWDGELGNGTTVHSTVPLPVSGLSSGVATVSAGNYHNCALTSAGAVKCWGNNFWGQLGNQAGPYSTVPVAVSGLSSGVADVDAGASLTCALTQTGAAKCWGWNAYGQLGNGTTTDSTVPVQVTGLSSGVVAISAGGAHACAVTTTGAAKCWGANYYGQLGNGTQTDSAVPVPVSGLSSGVVAITAADGDTCAVTSGGAVKCWGANWDGQLGNGTTDMSLVPVNVSGLASGVAEVAAASGHSCARTNAGGVKCWGHNADGELGDGTKENRAVPVAVSGLGSGVVDIATGYAHSCAVTTAGTGKCWGRNFDGQLGNGTREPSTVPVDMAATPVLHIYLPFYYSTVISGMTLTVTAKIVDAFGNVIDYSGPASWSDLSGTLAPTTPSPFAGGVSTTQGVTFSSPYSGNRITISGDGLTAQTNSFNVIRISKLDVRVVTPIYAGQQFTVKVTALDAAGKRMYYNGAASWSDLSGHLSPASPANFVDGVSTTTATISAPFHNDTITVTSGGTSGTSGLFHVFGPPAKITLSVLAPLTVGVPATVNAYAYDAAGNFLRTYNGAATWSDLSGALSPSAPASFVNGVSTTTATISTPYAGDQITLTSNGISGKSAFFRVLGPLAKIALRPIDSATVGVPFVVKAYALDAAGNTLSTYNQPATWSDLSGTISPVAPSDFVDGISRTTTTIGAHFANDQITFSSGGISGKSNLFHVF